uniref:Uncharacterized protein n=1 Tax=Nelumbo nucifera TaxID=4432 RepID=A0A822ZHX3_NELNU|nr:TPA_asm: hypothetical protein HUJ06_002972 [Nelumbo nucifera]
MGIIRKKGGSDTFLQTLPRTRQGGGVWCDETEKEAFDVTILERICCCLPCRSTLSSLFLSISSQALSLSVSLVWCSDEPLQSWIYRT